jgi:hypothetical protein
MGKEQMNDIDLQKELDRIEALSHSAWYYPGSKPNLEGEAKQDIKFLIKVIKNLINNTQEKK